MAAVDIRTLLSPDAEWQIAQLALDCLDTELSDTRPTVSVVLPPPVESIQKILLRLQGWAFRHAGLTSSCRVCGVRWNRWSER
jgi:hypothetical protein